ncbi:MAG: hypothetical protein R3E08_05645 [Thiotrichaceae bacterium]
MTTSVIPDTTPPNFNSTPAISAITTSSFTLTINSNEIGKAYYAYCPAVALSQVLQLSAGGNFISITAQITIFLKLSVD